MKLLIAFVLFISSLNALVLAVGQGEKPSAPWAQEKFDPKRDSARDILDGVKYATKLNKPIILDVGGEWCGWCHKLDKMFKEDTEVAEMLKKFVVIKVNFSQDNENKAVLSKYPEIKGYPHLFVLDKAGKLLHSQDTGLLETGDHHDHDKVMTFLKKWAG